MLYWGSGHSKHQSLMSTRLPTCPQHHCRRHSSSPQLQQKRDQCGSRGGRICPWHIYSTAPTWGFTYCKYVGMLSFCCPLVMQSQTMRLYALSLVHGLTDHGGNPVPRVSCRCSQAPVLGQVGWRQWSWGQIGLFRSGSLRRAPLPA